MKLAQDDSALLNSIAQCVVTLMLVWCLAVRWQAADALDGMLRVDSHASIAASEDRADLWRARQGLNYCAGHPHLQNIGMNSLFNLTSSWLVEHGSIR